MFKLIIVYEIAFLIFWNVLYMSNSGIENWFQEKFLAGVYTVLSTMALGFALVYVIFITLRISGISDKLKKLKDPRKNQK
tara:strand:- start:285 stop:524 length:240 start_codon:yes stop_codon:yes gene_type:complete